MRIELKDENQEEPQKIDENDIRYKHETDLTKKEKRELEKMKLAFTLLSAEMLQVWQEGGFQVSTFLPENGTKCGTWSEGI